jgi:hypothetical protein
MGAYSFLDVNATIIGPGLAAQIGNGAGSAADGSIATAFDEDKTKTDTGSDGSLMHSLRATQTGIITVKLLKVSPINSVLSSAYAFQRQSTGNWGINVIRITNKVSGDVATGNQMAFVKYPENEWAENGNMLSWTFRGIVTELLGANTPVAA